MTTTHSPLQISGWQSRPKELYMHGNPQESDRHRREDAPHVQRVRKRGGKRYRCPPECTVPTPSEPSIQSSLRLSPGAPQMASPPPVSTVAVREPREERPAEQAYCPSVCSEAARVPGREAARVAGARRRARAPARTRTRTRSRSWGVLHPPPRRSAPSPSASRHAARAGGSSTS